MDVGSAIRLSIFNCPLHSRVSSTVCYVGKPRIADSRRSKASAVSAPVRSRAEAPSSSVDTSFLGVPGVDYFSSASHGEGGRCTDSSDLSRGSDAGAGPCDLDNLRDQRATPSIVHNARRAAELRGTSKKLPSDRGARRTALSGPGQRASDQRRRSRQPREPVKGPGLLNRTDEGACCRAVQVSPTAEMSAMCWIVSHVAWNGE